MMDMIGRQMIQSHERWLFICRFIWGHGQGDLMYMATARFMTLPEER